MKPDPGGENWRPPPPDWQAPKPHWQSAPQPWQSAPQPWPAVQPIPNPNPNLTAAQVTAEPRRPRRRGWLLLAALLSAVLAVLLGISAVNRYAEARGPGSVVRGYFQALADGNAPAALAYADAPPRGQFLTSVVLGQQLQAASLSDISILRTTQVGSSATVDVRYRLQFPSGSQSVADSAELVRRRSSWRLTRVASTVSLAIQTAGADRLSFAGRPLPTAAVTLFPGALPLAADSPALQVDGQPLVRLADIRTVTKAAISLTPQLRGQVLRAVSKLFTDCLAATSNDARCPVPDSDRPIPGSVHGQASRALAATQPRIELDGELIKIRAEVPVRASWKVWDFENQPLQRRGSTILSIRAWLALDQPTKAFWDWS